MSRPRSALFIGLMSCGADPSHAVDTATATGHGPIAAAISGPLGTAWPTATADQLAAFERGADLATTRMAYADGLGPAFNVTFCGACHEKPTQGGSAGLYRSFFLTGVRTESGAFFPASNAGEAGGVVRLYHRPDDTLPAHPALDPDTNVIAQRNPIPFYGVGLIAELSDAELLRRADPDDADGDGISGRANTDRGFVGRFGRKAQTVSIEGFIRGPLFNHMGITTDPLSETQRAALPVDSSANAAGGASRRIMLGLLPYAQAAAPDGPLVDDDGVPDPEMSSDALFDLVSFAMLMAAPEVRTELTETEATGMAHFDSLGCGDCHTPRLEGPRGPLPVYSDLLLHDMGDDLADGLEAGEATGSEFRTQPLWGVSAVGPYLHDGRADTLNEAISWHGGEAAASARDWAAMDSVAHAELEAFLLALGGADMASEGMLLPGDVAPEPGDLGGPIAGLDADETRRFEAGRRLFDREFGVSEGVGGPRMNGDSCRACHFEPALGGAGPRGVSVIRHGILNESEAFIPPLVGTILHRGTTLQDSLNRPQAEATIFELRQTPHLFGLGLVDAIPDAVITAQADPTDADGDGVSGRVSWVDGGRIGRLGWKGSVPDLAEFVRDALTAEMGLTLPHVDGMSFGRQRDDDDVPDPELTADDAALLTDFLRALAPPPRRVPDDPDSADQGEAAFTELGCARCHTPSLEGPDGPVALYSDLLLHDILPPGSPGVEEAGASATEFRTPPLWGLSHTGPWLHDGSADTLTDAIDGHAGEAAAAVEAWTATSDSERAALIIFLETL